MNNDKEPKRQCLINAAIDSIGYGAVAIGTHKVFDSTTFKNIDIEDMATFFVADFVACYASEWEYVEKNLTIKGDSLPKCFRGAALFKIGFVSIALILKNMLMGHSHSKIIGNIVNVGLSIPGVKALKSAGGYAEEYLIIKEK
jgi:hypothetical protein